MNLIKKISKIIKSNYRYLVRPKIILLNHVALSLDDNVSADVARYIYNESYEADEANAIRGLLKFGDKVLEVGSGIGFLTILAAKIVGSENVLSYEANPELIKTIKKNLSLNNCLVIVKNFILTNTTGYKKFYIEKDFWSSSTAKRNNTKRVIKIPTENINKILKSYQPNVLIIDIEGGEVDLIPVINMSKIKKIIIEIHPHVSGYESSSKVLELILSLGFYVNFRYSNNSTWVFEKNPV